MHLFCPVLWLCSALPCCTTLCAELAIGNIVRRVLHMIREEQQQEQLGHSEGGTAAIDAADQQQVGANQQAYGYPIPKCRQCRRAWHPHDPTALHTQRHQHTDAQDTQAADNSQRAPLGCCGVLHWLLSSACRHATG